MRCIDKSKRILFVVAACFLFLNGCSAGSLITDYEKETYGNNLYESHLASEELCVSSEDVELPGFTTDTSLYAAALFDVTGKKVDYAYHIHDKIYPASTTKILTALVAIENCSLDDIVTISSRGAASAFAIDAQVCGLREGDQLTLEALLYGLLLHSGNDNAVAIAEYVGGSIDNFCAMMNERAKSLHAVNTHFVSPNGLHDDDHYTTAYDMYLLFNACIKNDAFLDIIDSSYYTADIRGADGSVRQETWYPTSFYARGEAELPYGASIIGGKTGYTGEAGNCLILLDETENGNKYISVVMGAETKPLMYEDMSKIINQIGTY